jgi:hypothetical protein
MSSERIYSTFNLKELIWKLEVRWYQNNNEGASIGEGDRCSFGDGVKFSLGEEKGNQCTIL